MERYRILPHTADGKFRAYGATLEEAFGNAALAMSSFMWDWSKVEPRIRHFVHVRGILDQRHPGGSGQLLGGKFANFRVRLLACHFLLLLGL